MILDRDHATQMALALDHVHLYRSLEDRALAMQVQAEALSTSSADLARARRLKHEFLAMMSHELRTPLTAVLGHRFPKRRFVPSWIRINIFTKLRLADRAETIIRVREAGLGR